MRLFSKYIIILLTLISVSACGGRELITSSSAIGTSANPHPLVGDWVFTDGTQDLHIHENGTSIVQACDSQAIIGDVSPRDTTECGSNSKSCGSFPYLVSQALNSPTCIGAGSYICFYNVYRVASKDYLIMNCSDGSGPFYYSRQ